MAVKDTNIFVAALKLSDLTVETAKSSARAREEFWSGGAILGDSVFVLANDTVNKLGLGYILNLSDLSSELQAKTYENGYANAIASNGTHLGLIYIDIDGEDANFTFGLSTLEEENNSVKELIDNSLTFYPNPVKNVLNLNKTSDISIYSVSGQLVAQAANARQINLEHLTSGSYIVTAKNADGVKRVSFIKE